MLSPDFNTDSLGASAVIQPQASSTADSDLPLNSTPSTQLVTAELTRGLNGTSEGAESGHNAEANPNANANPNTYAYSGLSQNPAVRSDMGQQSQSGPQATTESSKPLSYVEPATVTDASVNLLADKRSPPSKSNVARKAYTKTSKTKKQIAAEKKMMENLRKKSTTPENAQVSNCVKRLLRAIGVTQIVLSVFMLVAEIAGKILFPLYSGNFVLALMSAVSFGISGVLSRLAGLDRRQYVLPLFLLTFLNCLFAALLFFLGITSCFLNQIGGNQATIIMKLVHGLEALVGVLELPMNMHLSVLLRKLYRPQNYCEDLCLRLATARLVGRLSILTR